MLVLVFKWLCVLKRVQLMIMENEPNATVQHIKMKVKRLKRNHDLMLLILFLSKFAYYFCAFISNLVFLFD